MKYRSSKKWISLLLCALVAGGSIWPAAQTAAASEIVGQTDETAAADGLDHDNLEDDLTAESQADVYVELEPESFIPETAQTEDPDELLSAYLDQELYGPAPSMNLLMAAPKTAGAYLSGNDRTVYQILREHIEKIAAGEETVSQIEISMAEMGFENECWTAEDLGGIPVFNGNEVNPDAKAKMAELVGFSLDRVINALLADCPYELYWYDKTASSGKSGLGMRFAGDSVLGERIYVTTPYIITLPVAAEYAADTYQADPAKTGAVQTAVTNIHDIVARYEGAADRQKLDAYRAEICSRTSYNSDAAASSDIAYGNPWQLIWIFDDDPNTTVVCEGYAKAFMHLCDLSVFASDQIRCITVTGTMNGGTGAGAHMWNMVRMEDGKNYLVDVTNCDAGTIGADDKLFLVGTDAQNQYGYLIQAGTRSIAYNYDSDTLSAYTADDLMIAEANYGTIIEPEVTPTPEPTPEVTPTPEPTPEITPTPEPTPEVTPTPEPTPEVTPTPEPTPEVTPTPEPTPEVTPTPEPTPEVTPTPEPTPEVTPTPEPTPEVTPTPEPTPEVTPTPEPTPEPARITSMTITSSGIKTVWSASEGAVSYVLYRKAGSGAWKALIKTEKRTYTDTSVKTGTTYRYAVSSVGEGGSESPYAISSMSRRFLAPVKPKLANTTSGIKLSWTKAAGATSYQIFRRTEKGSYSSTPLKKTTALSWTDTAVKAKDGSSYIYAVVACYGSGNAASKSVKSDRRIVRLVTPALSSTKSTAAGKITVSWTRSSKATGYQIQYSTDSSFASGNKTVTVTKNTITSKVLSSLKKGRTYYVRIRKYKTVSGVNYYSAWSAKRKTVVKK